MLAQATKYVATNFIKKDVSRFIPICSVIYGIILSIIGHYTSTTNIGSNLIEAIFIGASAGGASVAGHQTYKQLSKGKSSVEEESVEDTLEDEDELI